MLIHADARSIPLKDGCVQCVVTSPPYFGLRDYGTGTWVGGDPNCSHVEQRGGRNPETSAKQLTNQGTVLTQYRAVCAVCAVCAAQREDSQIGLELTPADYIAALLVVFREVVAERLGRRGVGTDLNPAYHELAKERTAQRGLIFTAG